MAPTFLGFDHLDVRVRSLSAVEAFYDRLLPELGLPGKLRSFVDVSGARRNVRSDEPYNVVEYFERNPEPGPPRFIGIIEEPTMQPAATRIAFALATPQDVRAWQTRLPDYGARAVEVEDDFDAYPAVFFEDPAGTRLELCARRKRGE